MSATNTSESGQYVDPLLIKIAQDENFTIDDRIINAWEAGINKGRTQADEVLYESFIRSLSYCLKKADELYQFLNNKGIEVNILFLKDTGLKSFEGLMVVEKEYYLNKDARKDIYNKILEIKKSALKEEKIYFEIALMPFSENINMSVIKSEGFVFQHKLTTAAS